MAEEKKKGDQLVTKIFFLIAYAFFALAATLSALGSFFVYTGAGLGIFFAYLATARWFRSSPVSFTWNNVRSTKSRYDEQFRNPVSASTRPVIIIVASAFAAVFLLIVMVIIFSDSNESENLSTTEIFRRRGEEFYYQQLYDSAEFFFRKTRGNSEGLYWMGNVKAVTKSYDSALYFYNAALALDPGMSLAKYGRAWVYYDQELYDESTRLLRGLLRDDPAYTDAYLLAGDAFYVRNEYDSALKYYEPAYASGARSATFLNILAYIHDTKGNSAKAISLYQETLEYDTTLTGVYQRLGELLPGEEGEEYRIRAVP
jgi:tetratricopeptide (TPR) repeat protein